ncbi:MAG: spermidine synthase [Rubrivivax sp.]|jgi:spermidine synthase
MKASDRELPPVTLSEHEGVRYLHLGSVWVQGAMRIRRPQAIELVYVQRMLASLLWLPTEALGQGPALQLGLGAGAITRFTLNQLKMATTVVEIHPELVEVCRRWFHLQTQDPRLRVVVGDAGAWLRDVQAPAEVQLLHVDLYDEEAAAPVLDDVAFYADCRRALAPGGVMAVNLFGRDASFETSLLRIVEAFGPDQVWHLQPTREGNTVVVAGREVEVPGRDVLQARAESLEQRFGALGLTARRWLTQVRPYRPRGAT